MEMELPGLLAQQSGTRPKGHMSTRGSKNHNLLSTEKTKNKKETNTMATRKFYGAGDAKGFNKKNFFEAVLAIVNGEEVDDATMDLVAQAAAYELEGIALAKEKAGTKEKVPTLEKQIAKDIIAGLVPLLTGEPQTTTQLIEIATQKGLTTTKGTNFSNPWVNTVFSALAAEGKVKKVNAIVNVTKKGPNGEALKGQETRVAYTR